MIRKLVVVLSILLAAVSIASADTRNLDVDLEGFQEVPAVSTVGTGQFTARISKDETSISWKLSYSDLESAVQQAHIHLGQFSVNGGITVFLCTNLGNGPVGTQPCPPSPATISGTIMAADVSPNIPATAAARSQGLNTGELAELIRAIRAGVTYANVHTADRPGGEVRGQLGHGHGHGHDD
jgi:hypothetical protein